MKCSEIERERETKGVVRPRCIEIIFVALEEQARMEYSWSDFIDSSGASDI